MGGFVATQSTQLSLPLRRKVIFWAQNVDSTIRGWVSNGNDLENRPKMAIKSAKAWEFDQIVSWIQGGWSIHHRKEWNPRSQSKLKRQNSPKKTSWLKGAAKTPFFLQFVFALAFPSRRITGDDHPFDQELFPPGEPRPHQRLQALARRAEAAEEEL